MKELYLFQAVIEVSVAVLDLVEVGVSQPEGQTETLPSVGQI